MKEETTNQLVACITHVFEAVAECQLKLVALENAINKHDPALVRLWSTEIESLNSLRAYEIDNSPISNLNAMLRRE